MKRFARTPVMLALVLACAFTAHVPAQSTNGAKKTIGFDDYSRWRSIEGSRISGDGQWVAYGYRHPSSLDPKPELHILRLDSGKDETVANALQPAFSDDSRWVAYFVDMPYAEAKKLRDADKPVTREVQLRNLDTVATASWKDMQSFSFARGSGQLLMRRRQAAP